MTPEQKRAVEGAMTALATMPHYCGCVVVLFTDAFRTATMHQHAVRDDLADAALQGLVRQRALARSPIVVPADYRNRAQRRDDDGG